MKFVTHMTSDERKAEFKKYVEARVNKKSAKRYIDDLERGFLAAPIAGYNSIYDITDPDLLQDVTATRELRNCSIFTRETSGGTAGLAGLNKYISFLKYGRDSYYDFMNHFNITSRKLFNWGIDAIIFPEEEKIESRWQDLRDRVFNNEEVYIRGYGRDAHGTKLYTEFYAFVFKNENIKKDPNNNSKPKAIIEEVTGLSRNKDIYNYQISHIWGRTKNVFLFEAPWNICYTSKIIDPFTGHETKGDLPENFHKQFIKCAQKKYKKFIMEYNEIIDFYNIPNKLDEYCDSNNITNNRFKADALKELSPIELIK